MAANDYHFITVWRVQSSLSEINAVLGNGPELARWWPSVYLDVQEVLPGNPDGIGKVISLYTKGWLPYTLRWQFRVTEVHYPYGFTIEARGDFDGQGIWTFEPESGERDPEKQDWIKITYDWKIAAEKPLLKNYSFIMKPLFSANHRWAMARGEESLNFELARRHAQSQAERDRIPNPPSPTFGFLLPKNGKAMAKLLD